MRMKTENKMKLRNPRKTRRTRRGRSPRQIRISMQMTKKMWLMCLRRLGKTTIKRKRALPGINPRNGKMVRWLIK